MNEEIINLIKNSYQSFVGTGMYIDIFLISIVYVFTQFRKEDKNSEKKIRVILGYFSIIIFVLVMNPYFAKIMVEVNGESVYWRVYWLLPLAISIAFMFTEFIYKNDKVINKIIVGVLCIITLGVCGKFMYTSENFSKVNNYYKIPDDIFEIIKIVSEDDEDYKKLAGPLEFEIYTRQYDGTIILVAPRSFSGQYGKTSIITYLNSGELKKVYYKAKETKCNYVVMNHESEKEDDSLINYGFEVLGSNATYTLYKLDEINNEEKK